MIKSETKLQIFGTKSITVQYKLLCLSFNYNADRKLIKKITNGLFLLPDPYGNAVGVPTYIQRLSVYKN